MRKITLMLLLPAFICSSCGTGKKLEAANQQITILNGRIDSLNKINQDCRSSVTQLKAENIQYGREAEDCRKAKEVNAARLARYEQSLEQNGNSMEKIRDKIAKALEQFKDAGLSIKYKNGLVYVTMQDKLMFPSGSTKIKDLGRQALSVIADAMNEFPHLTVYVVGNTDTVPVIKGFKDNWSLSTERANVIVRILRDNYGADPFRIVAAGRGKYDPIADNATEEGRAQNRRIDIVLNPDLSRLWGMMERNE